MSIEHTSSYNRLFLYQPNWILTPSINQPPCYPTLFSNKPPVIWSYIKIIFENHLDPSMMQQYHKKKSVYLGLKLYQQQPSPREAGFMWVLCISYNPERWEKSSFSSQSVREVFFTWHSHITVSPYTAITNTTGVTSLTDNYIYKALQLCKTCQW